MEPRKSAGSMGGDGDDVMPSSSLPARFGTSSLHPSPQKIATWTPSTRRATDRPPAAAPAKASTIQPSTSSGSFAPTQPSRESGRFATAAQELAASSKRAASFYGLSALSESQSSSGYIPRQSGGSDPGQQPSFPPASTATSSSSPRTSPTQVALQAAIADENRAEFNGITHNVVSFLPKTGRGRSAVIERPYPLSQAVLKRLTVSKSELQMLEKFKSLLSHANEAPALIPILELSSQPVSAQQEKYTVDIISQHIVSGREITSKIGQNQPRPQEAQLKRWLYRLLEALALLHRNKILHGGIKPKNILIGPSDDVSLVDAAAATLDPSLLPSDVNAAASLSLYRPPDWINPPQPEKVDIWGVGMVFFQLIAQSNIEKKYAVNGSIGAELKRDEAKSRAFYGEFQSVASAYSNDLVMIIRSMISLDPRKRPTASELLASDYFSDFRREVFSARDRDSASSNASRISQEYNNSPRPSESSVSSQQSAGGDKEQRRIWLLFSLQPYIDGKEDASSLKNFSDVELTGSGAASLPEYSLELAYEESAGVPRVVLLSTDSRRCINGEVSWNDVVSSQWQLVDKKPILITVFKKSGRKSNDSSVFGELRLVDGDLETGEEFYLQTSDNNSSGDKNNDTTFSGVLIIQAAERNPEYKRERSSLAPRRSDVTADDSGSEIPVPDIQLLTEKSPRTELRLSKIDPSKARKQSLAQKVALERMAQRTFSVSSTDSSNPSLDGQNVISSGSAARRRRGLKPLLRAAASFREFNVQIRIWDGHEMRDQDPNQQPTDITHDLVLFVASGEPLQHFVPPMPVRIITLSWNQNSMNMQSVWYFSFEIVIICMEIVKSLIEWGVGVQRKFLIYGGGLWGAILVKQLCALERLHQFDASANQDSPVETQERQTPLKQFFSHLQGVMIHKDCILSLEFKAFMEEIVDLVRQTQALNASSELVPESPRSRLNNNGGGSNDDSGEEEAVPANLMYMWALEKHFAAYEHCILGEAVDDWTNFVMGKLSLHTMHEALQNVKKMTRAATISNLRSLSNSSSGSRASFSSTSTKQRPVSVMSGVSDQNILSMIQHGGSVEILLQADGSVQFVWGSSDSIVVVNESFRWIYPNIIAALRMIQTQCDAKDLEELGQLLLEAKIQISLLGEARLIDLAKSFILFVLQLEVEDSDTLFKQAPAFGSKLLQQQARSSDTKFSVTKSDMRKETSRYEMKHIQELVNPLSECLNAVKSLGALQSPDLDVEDLKRIQAELEDRSTIRISFFGARSVGKSTLLNALLGRDLAYLSANESTGCVTEMWHCPPDKNEYMEVVFISLDEFTAMRSEMSEKVRWIEDQLSQMREQQQQQLMSAVAGAVDAQGSIKINNANELEKLIELNQKLLNQLKSKLKQLKKLYRDNVINGAPTSPQSRARNPSSSSVDSDQMIQAESQRVGWFHNFKKPFPLSQENLAAYSALSDDPNNASLADIVKTIKVYLKCDALKNLTILDTPGFQKTVHYREARTNYALSQANMWIYLSRADSLDAGQELRFVQQLKEGSDRGLIVFTNYDLLVDKASSFNTAVKSKLKDLEGVLEVDRAPATAANLLMKLREAIKSGRKLKKKFDLEITELLGFVCGLESQALQSDFTEYVGHAGKDQSNRIYSDATMELSGMVSLFEQLRSATHSEMESVLLSIYNELDYIIRISGSNLIVRLLSQQAALERSHHIEQAQAYLNALMLSRSRLAEKMTKFRHEEEKLVKRARDHGEKLIKELQGELFQFLKSEPFASLLAEMTANEDAWPHRAFKFVTIREPIDISSVYDVFVKKHVVNTVSEYVKRIVRDVGDSKIVDYKPLTPEKLKEIRLSLQKRLDGLGQHTVLYVVSRFQSEKEAIKNWKHKVTHSCYRRMVAILAEARAFYDVSVVQSLQRTIARRYATLTERLTKLDSDIKDYRVIVDNSSLEAGKDKTRDIEDAIEQTSESIRKIMDIYADSIYPNCVQHNQRWFF